MGVFATVPRRAVGAHIVSQFVAWARRAQISILWRTDLEQSPGLPRDLCEGNASQSSNRCPLHKYIPWPGIPAFKETPLPWENIPAS